MEYTEEYLRGWTSIGFGRAIAQLGEWTRKIGRFEPGFDWKQIPGPSGRIEKVKIVNCRICSVLPSTEFRSFSEFYNEMHSLATYYQVIQRKPMRPPPSWLSKEGREFWWNISQHTKEYNRNHRWVKRFGNDLSIQVTENDGTKQMVQTKTQLIWINAEYGADGSKEIELYAFHYLPQIDDSVDPLHARAFADWNHSMFHYIERKLVRPDIAREMLAGVNRELEKILIKAFFGGGGGIVKVSGNAAHIADTIKNIFDLFNWYQGYTSQENQEVLKWYRRYLSNNRN